MHPHPLADLLKFLFFDVARKGVYMRFQEESLPSGWKGSYSYPTPCIRVLATLHSTCTNLCCSFLFSLTLASSFMAATRPACQHHQDGFQCMGMAELQAECTLCPGFAQQCFIYIGRRTMTLRLHLLPFTHLVAHLLKIASNWKV